MSEQPPEPEQPFVERRRRKRWLTKRNVLIAVAAIVAIFLGISVWSEMSGSDDDGYGRLYSRRTDLPELPERRPYEVIGEQEIEAQAGVDPLLVEGMRREQILGVEPGMLEKQHGISTDPRLEYGFDSEGPLLGRESDRKEAEVEITGGPDGVRIEKKDQ